MGWTATMADRRRQAHGRSDRMVWIIAGAVVVGVSVLMGVVVIPALTAEVDEPDAPVTAADAAFLYERNCGTCHGLEGQGNIGPQLADGAVVAAYPDIEDQLAVITDGRAGMPPFGDSLTEAEIRAVAEHTRGL